MFDWSFSVLKLILQVTYCNYGFWWCSKSPIWPNFSWKLSHLTYKLPDLHKISLFYSYFNIFLTKYCYPLPVILSPTPLKSKAEHRLHELHVQTILYKCLAKDNNWSLRVQCMTINYILLLRFYISQQRQDWSVKLYMKWTQSSD